MSRRQKWTDSEDYTLRQLYESGVRDWAEISRRMVEAGVRKNPKQICERWKNILNPCVNRESIASEQFREIFQLQGEFKNKWSLIAEKFPGRTDNAIKNKFFSLIRLALRKANRLVECFSSTRWVNSLKPKVLLSFLEHREALTCKAQALPFSQESLSGRDFILFFVELDMADAPRLANPSDRAIVLQFLAKLDQLNRQYSNSDPSSKSRKIKKTRQKLHNPTSPSETCHSFSEVCFDPLPPSSLRPRTSLSSLPPSTPKSSAPSPEAPSVIQIPRLIIPEIVGPSSQPTARPPNACPLRLPIAKLPSLQTPSSFISIAETGDHSSRSERLSDFFIFPFQGRKVEHPWTPSKYTILH
mgnify:CR=1 FL=1